MAPDYLRLLDANLNRSSEGLRVLEDVARFVADDVSLSRDLRLARHSLADMGKGLDVEMLSARDTVNDVGRESGLRVEGERDLLSVIRANAKRAEESLRVIEELARFPDAPRTVDVAVAERLRYLVYDFEKRLTGRVLRSERTGNLRGLYVVVDRQAAGARALAGIAEEAIDGGASVIQLRDKKSERGEVYREALEVAAVCRQKGAAFIMNDYADIAALVDADGLHIGQCDLPVASVRSLLPLRALVGVSCETEAEIERALEDGADYVAVGAVFPTTQKEVQRVTGLGLVHWSRERIGAVPLVAIGGIGLENVESVIESGADAAAVIGAVVMQPDVRHAAAEMSAAIERAVKRRQEHGKRSA
jgi:thiamine-phosphate pyrophosphorylase